MYAAASATRRATPKRAFRQSRCRFYGSMADCSMQCSSTLQPASQSSQRGVLDLDVAAAADARDEDHGRGADAG